MNKSEGVKQELRICRINDCIKDYTLEYLHHVNSMPIDRFLGTILKYTPGVIDSLMNQFADGAGL